MEYVSSHLSFEESRIYLTLLLFMILHFNQLFISLVLHKTDRKLEQKSFGRCSLIIDHIAFDQMRGRLYYYQSWDTSFKLLQGEIVSNTYQSVAE